MISIRYTNYKFKYKCQNLNLSDSLTFAESAFSLNIPLKKKKTQSYVECMDV